MGNAANDSFDNIGNINNWMRRVNLHSIDVVDIRQITTSELQ